MWVKIIVLPASAARLSMVVANPVQVLLECMLASLLCCCGILGVVGKFKDTRLTIELNAR